MCIVTYMNSTATTEADRDALSERLYEVQFLCPFIDDAWIAAWNGYCDNAWMPDSFEFYGHLTVQDLVAGATNEAECSHGHYA